ncbi:hypothetical protein SMICM304S_02183 [Streptomyces microflavus]
MSLFSGWRAALRIARRDAVRAKGRSALVVAMIALPVLGVTAADLTYRSALPTLAEELTADLGAADALFTDRGWARSGWNRCPTASCGRRPRTPRRRSPTTSGSPSTYRRPSRRDRATSPSSPYPPP